jgi:hypothetical protein
MHVHVVLLQSFASIPHQWQMMASGWVKQEQATAKQWWALQQSHICEFKTWIMINVDQLHHLKISWHTSSMCFFSHFDSITHQWQMMASGSNRNKQQQDSGGHCSNRIFVNSRHGL